MNWLTTVLLQTKQAKMRSERRKHCALAAVRWSQNFRPVADPFTGAQEVQNLISWRWSLPSHTDQVWWGSIYAISSYRGNRPTNKQTQPQTHREDRLQYTAPLSLARSVIIKCHYLVQRKLYAMYGINCGRICFSQNRCERTACCLVRHRWYEISV